MTKKRIAKLQLRCDEDEKSVPTKGGSEQRGEELVHPESMGGNSWKKAQGETRRKTLPQTAISFTL